MSNANILTEFVVPAGDFLMKRTLERIPGMRIEIERVAVEDEDVTPFFWAGGGDFDAFEAALADDPTVDDLVLVERHADERLYRVDWRRNVESVVYAIAGTNATILQAVSDDGSAWTVEMRFASEDDLSMFQDYTATHDLSFELVRLRHSAHPEALGRYEVTDEQREALVAAYELGYFEIPGDAALDDVAGELGISKNAASERLKRGYANLVRNTLVHDE